MSQIFTGARGIVKINGSTVAFIGGINVTIENTLTDVDVIGQLEIGALAETGHKCNFSVNYFKVIDEGTGDVTNTAALIGIDTSTDASVASMRSQTPFQVEIDDDQKGKTVFVMTDCKFEGGSGQVDARGLWQGTWNFRAIRGSRL